MGIFDFLTGEFIDVIHHTDETNDTIVWRFEREDHEIKYGAKLTVREGQAAVFVHEGQLADVFTPGMYMLETNNMPIMTTLQHWHHGFESPFKSEIYFVNTTRFQDLKWGTKNHTAPTRSAFQTPRNSCAKWLERMASLQPTRSPTKSATTSWRGPPQRLHPAVFL
jgi:membrane protease subunit (stomatin/prohibitin family)